MKKSKENKKTVPSKVKAKPLDICDNCSNKYCPGTSKSSEISVSRKKTNLTPKVSKTSIGKKVSKISNNANCNCSNYLDHVAMLDIMTDDNICSCGIFAKALRSNIHMHIGTLVHQECSNSATEDNLTENN